MGPSIAQTILQRELYVRTKFTFKLSWEYCLLDPMDVVTITDANLGLSNYPVRIIEIEEDDKGLLSFTCEELVAGVSNPALNPSRKRRQVSSRTGRSRGPDQFAAHLSSRRQRCHERRIARSGLERPAATAAISVNGAAPTSSPQSTTSPIRRSASSQRQLRQGLLTASLPAAAGWDPVDTLSVDLTKSHGTLSGTTQTAAQQGATLSLVDGELLAYELATLTTGQYAYNLTGLARGQGTSTPTAHSTGSTFFRLDGAVVKYNLPSNFLGQTGYFKFQSFNVFGGGLEDLSTCTVYTHGISPPSALHPIAAQLETGFALDLGQVAGSPTLADDFGHLASDAVVDTIDLGSVSVTVVHPIAVQLQSGATIDFGLTTGALTLSDDFGSTNDAVIDVINLGTVP